jgi:ribosome maturation factor RimP
VTVAERVHDIVEPLLAARHLELFDVEYAPPRLRILVDRAWGPSGPQSGQQGGVDLDTLGEVTRVVSHALDEHDPIPGRYTLEVSSPGVERPLRTPTHFTRAIGAAVAIRTHPGVEPRRVAGTLSGADGEGITVRLDQPDDDGRTEVRVGYGDIERARTVFTWGEPAPKPGKQKKTKKAASR